MRNPENSCFRASAHWCICASEFPIRVPNPCNPCSTPCIRVHNPCGAAAPRWAAWAEKERPAAYAPWPETLRLLAARTRKDLLSDLRALEPVLFALGGEETVAETFRAIQHVGRW